MGFVGSKCNSCNIKVKAHWLLATLLFMVGFFLLLLLTIWSTNEYGAIGLFVSLCIWFCFDLTYAVIVPLEQV